MKSLSARWILGVSVATMALSARAGEPVVLPMEASVASVSAAPEDRLAGTLRLQIDPGSIAPLRVESRRSKIRVTLVLEQPTGPPDVRHFEIATPPDSSVNVWIHETPLRWKKTFRTLTVRLELEGAVVPARAVASLKLPRAPGAAASSREVPKPGREGAAAASGTGGFAPLSLPLHGEIGGAPAASWRPSDELVVLVGPDGVLDRLAASGRDPLLRVLVIADRNADPSLIPPARISNGPCSELGNLGAVRGVIFCQDFGVPFSEVDAWRIRLPALHPSAGTLRLRVEVEEVWTRSWGAFVVPVAKAR